MNSIRWTLTQGILFLFLESMKIYRFSFYVQNQLLANYKLVSKFLPLSVHLFAIVRE